MMGEKQNKERLRAIKNYRPLRREDALSEYEAKHGKGSCTKTEMIVDCDKKPKTLKYGVDTPMEDMNWDHSPVSRRVRWYHTKASAAVLNAPPDRVWPTDSNHKRRRVTFGEVASWQPWDHDAKSKAYKMWFHHDYVGGQDDNVKMDWWLDAKGAQRITLMNAVDQDRDLSVSISKWMSEVKCGNPPAGYDSCHKWWFGPTDLASPNNWEFVVAGKAYLVAAICITAQLVCFPANKSEVKGRSWKPPADLRRGRQGARPRVNPLDGSSRVASQGGMPTEPDPLGSLPADKLLEGWRSTLRREFAARDLGISRWFARPTLYTIGAQEEVSDDNNCSCGC